MKMHRYLAVPAGARRRVAARGAARPSAVTSSIRPNRWSYRSRARRHPPRRPALLPAHPPRAPRTRTAPALATATSLVKFPSMMLILRSRRSPRTLRRPRGTARSRRSWNGGRGRAGHRLPRLRPHKPRRPPRCSLCSPVRGIKLDCWPIFPRAVCQLNS